MSTTASTLITAIRLRLADSSDEAYGDALLLSFINEGSREFADLTGCCQAIHNFTSGTGSTIDLGTLTYAFLNIYSVEYASGKLDFAPRYEAAKWSPAAGTPAGWSVWNDTLYLDTSITMSSSNDVDVGYTYVPNTLTAVGSNIGLPDKWLPALKAYVCYRIHDMNRETGFADRAYQEYLLIVQAAQRINEALMSGGGYS